MRLSIVSTPMIVLMVWVNDVVLIVVIVCVCLCGFRAQDRFVRKSQGQEPANELSVVVLFPYLQRWGGVPRPN